MNPCPFCADGLKPDPDGTHPSTCGPASCLEAHGGTRAEARAPRSGPHPAPPPPAAAATAAAGATWCLCVQADDRGRACLVTLECRPADVAWCLPAPPWIIPLMPDTVQRLLRHRATLHTLFTDPLVLEDAPMPPTTPLGPSPSECERRAQDRLAHGATFRAGAEALRDIAGLHVLPDGDLMKALEQATRDYLDTHYPVLRAPWDGLAQGIYTLKQHDREAYARLRDYDREEWRMILASVLVPAVRAAVEAQGLSQGTASRILRCMATAEPPPAAGGHDPAAAWGAAADRQPDAGTHRGTPP